MTIQHHTQAVILAGGLARRLAGADKGLALLQNRPLVAHILQRLSTQVERVSLNINRSQAQYQALFPHLHRFSDRLTDFQGPLSGMLSSFEQIPSDYLLFVPCDSPFLPLNLLQKLAISLHINQADIAYAHDGERPHPTFALIHRRIQSDLQAYLDRGERRLLNFFTEQKSIAVDFSDQADAFKNFNCPEDFIHFSTKKDRLQPPILGITGYSGTGKTTLLEKLIPELIARGIKVGVIKHTHHHIELDKPGKDSHRLRLSGANPTMLVCDQRWALMKETASATHLSSLVSQMKNEEVDLILVEGFKQEPIPKIQLHRQGIASPLPEADAFTLALATDYLPINDKQLDINHIESIATFIVNYCRTHH